VSQSKDILAPTRDGNAAFTVDVEHGARITEFCVGTENILTGPEVNPINFGSTCWTSPQSQWGWPPIPEHDSSPYVVHGTGTEIEFRSQPSVKSGIVIIKRFRVDSDRETFSAEYVFENFSQAPQSIAPWEISRHPIGGLTFFPKGAGIEPHSTLKSIESEGAIWFDYDPTLIVNEGQKVFAHGAEGWVAHIDNSRRVLLIKTFPEITSAEQAPGEAQIELYADPNHTYVEVEQQGAYRTLAPAEQLSWKVIWRLRRLPAAINATPGNKDLLALVRALVE